MTQDQIITNVNTFILNRGGSYQNWYVGITKNISSRLFGDHRVTSSDDWIFCDAADAGVARAAEAHLLGLGCDDGPGGGDQETCNVYAYRKNGRTLP